MSITEQLEEERRLIDAATAGPWWAASHLTPVVVLSGTGSGSDVSVADEMTLDDAEFIAHARTALPVRNKQLAAVLALHDPVDIYSGGTTEDILAAVESGEDPILTVCRECTPAFVLEQIEDCEWSEDSMTVPYPCATRRAIEEAGR